jgi:hypothetical protein
MLRACLGQEARTGATLLAVAALAAIAILGSFISQRITAGRSNETGSPASKIQDRLHASLTSGGGHEVASCESGGKPIQVEGRDHEGFGVANLQPSDGFTNPKKLSLITAPDSRRQTREKVVPLPKRKPSMAKARTPPKITKRNDPDKLRGKQPPKQMSVGIGYDYNR